MIARNTVMSSNGSSGQFLDELKIRTFVESDAPAVRDLYEHGRLAGQQVRGDTAADIDDIRAAYLSAERSHFWVAEHEGTVLGMLGVAEDEPHRAEIRRLRVHPDYRDRGIGGRLMETALAFCHHHGYLKVVLDTAYESGAAVDLFERFAFQHDRTRTVGGKELLEFYLDLYHDRRSDEEE